MPLRLIPRSPLPPFTFSPSPPSPRELDSDGRTDENGAGPSNSTKPPTEYFPERDMQVFGAFPLGGRDEPGRAVVRCPKCRRASLEASYGEHQRICKHLLEGSPLVAKRATSGKSLKTSDNAKKRRASEDSDTESPRKKSHSQPSDRPINTLLSSVGPNGEEPWKGLKLKKSDIKRLKKEKERLARKQMKDKEKAEIAERKRLRATGPIDVDKQCGVINDKDLPCARSLTCKTHNVGAKRAVPGRSKTWDELHTEWQRANNPKFKEPSKIIPSKKDKGIGGGGSGGGGSGGIGGGNAARREGKHRPDDEDGGGRIMSEAEMRELVHFARMTGDRCKQVIGLIGSGGGTGSKSVSTAMSARKKKQPAKDSQYALPRPTMCNSTWAGNAGFSGVGETLVQALAARPPRAPPVLIIKPPGGGNRDKAGQGDMGASGSRGGVAPPADDGTGQVQPTKTKAQKTSTAASASASASASAGRVAPPNISPQAQIQLQQMQMQIAQSQSQSQSPVQGMNAQAMIAAAAAAAQSAINGVPGGINGLDQNVMGMLNGLGAGIGMGGVGGIPNGMGLQQGFQGMNMMQGQTQGYGVPS